MTEPTATDEVARGERFAFGKNWSRFLAVLDESRIVEAERSLTRMLDRPSLAGLTFLDVGSGSGLFSLAAHRLGARVHSFDFDPGSVACAEELRRRYATAGCTSSSWRIEQGSALDPGYLRGLGRFDIVYSWGVLHHTGHMWDALGNVAPLVAPGGLLYIAIYNDQGGASRRWTTVKRAYNRAPAPGKTAIVLGAGMFFEGRAALVRLSQGRSPLPFADWKAQQRVRGMSVWHDLVDWVGGYPFEVAKPEEILDFYRGRGFQLARLTTCGGGLGCNEFVFERSAP